MAEEHMDRVYAPFKASQLPWLDPRHVVLLDPIEDDGPTIVAAIGGRLALGPGVVVDPILVGLAFSVVTAGQFIDALTASAERDGLADALTSAVDQARTARQLQHKATGTPGMWVDTSDGQDAQWDAWWASQWPLDAPDGS